MGEKGEPVRRIVVVPMPVEQPVHVPQPKEPVKVPEKEPAE